MRHRAPPAALAVVLAAVPAGCSAGRGDGSPVAPAWSRVALPTADGGVPQVRAVACDGDGWWASGSSVGAEDRAPAMWRSSASGAALVPVMPSSFYGERAELVSVAAEQGSVVAVGTASGGAHGNPRPATWTLREGVLDEDPAAFDLYGGWNAVSMGPVATDGQRAVIVGAWRSDDGSVGGAAWVADDLTEFTRVDRDPALGSAPGERVRVLDAAAVPGGFVATGERSVGGALDGQVWQTVDGRSWERLPADGLDGGADVSLQAAAGGADPAVVAGTVAGDGGVRLGAWVRAGDRWDGGPIDISAPPGDATSVATTVVATDDAVLVGGRLGDRLVLAEGEPGGRWRPVTLPADVPTGPHVDLAACATGSTVVVVASDGASGRTSGLWVADRSAVASR